MKQRSSTRSFWTRARRSMITAGQSAFAAEDRINAGCGVSLHPCDSMDFPVYFERTKTENELKTTMGNLDVLDRLFGAIPTDR
ncbi:hypothetical protein BC936DRAFT_148619 [Jimgerdemannia flammicorona]|uniref:Uncharacterized protein n=1 Tax=Jimgerdemannia flammicorona TaxID=994334 RepID=A0A433D2U5_9FUNG|nr:hypothetical protein BC936DRAFT_148619 [Jimgerdemannia flammicorona]